jgi:hypothetical protein
VLGKVLGAQDRESIAEGFRKLHNSGVHALIPLFKCFMKSRNVDWLGHVVRMAETRNADRVLEANKKLGGHFEDKA